MPDERERIDGLDFLRGAASLAVCWFHLTSFHYPTPDGPGYALVRASGAYGWLGVEVFFVLSGFVIPYSLRRAGYRLGAYPTFILKRVARLDPPYLASIAVFLLLAYAQALYTGGTPKVEGEPVGWTRLLLHLGYLNGFFGQSWLNPSFWTLAIEFQFYLLMGLVFPLMSSRRRWLRLGSVACFVAPSLLTVEGGALYSTHLFRLAFLFVMGVVTFQRREGLAGRGEHAALLAASAAGAFVTLGTLPTLAGLLAVAVINFYNRESFVSGFFGNISYSLYLLHWPVGHQALSLFGSKLLGATSDAARLFALAFALGVCFAAAYLFYIAVERPAQRWSARFRYGRARRTTTPEEVSGIASPGTRQAAEPPVPSLAQSSAAD